MSTIFKEADSQQTTTSLEQAKVSFQAAIQPIIDAYAAEFKDGKLDVTLLDQEKKTLTEAVQRALRDGVDPYELVDIICSEVTVSPEMAQQLNIGDAKRGNIMAAWRLQAMKMICGDVLGLLKKVMRATEKS